MDRIDLVESFLNREPPHRAAINPNGKEDDVHATFAHPGDVDVARGIALAEVEIVGKEALGGVVVSVCDDRGEMESAGVETSRAAAPKRQTDKETSERIISPLSEMCARW